ncbi:hypothetical protein AWZ03_004275 [Drosophila navojoa]|uniref:Uncharacterized protein n=1 Tax=Drosophila navojoa TaxID=7232 RepID=A0A484BK02_DRONA|nr:hypothetical protein AWZ03_004275 [Drosophila navojoa]
MMMMLLMMAMAMAEADTEGDAETAAFSIQRSACNSMLLAQLLTGAAAAAAVGEVLGLVGNVGSTLLEPVVCLQESAVATLQQLLGGIGLESLATQRLVEAEVTLLEPELELAGPVTVTWGLGRGRGRGRG